MPVAATVRVARCVRPHPVDAQMARHVGVGFERVICSVSVIAKLISSRFYLCIVSTTTADGGDRLTVSS